MGSIDDLFVEDKPTRLVCIRFDKNYDVYIGRPSEFGNIYSHLDTSQAKFKVATRDEAVQKYHEYILTQHHLLKKLKNLEGKILGCWCLPHENCHGKILLMLIKQKAWLWYN